MMPLRIGGPEPPAGSHVGGNGPAQDDSVDAVGHSGYSSHDALSSRAHQFQRRARTPPGTRAIPGTLLAMSRGLRRLASLDPSRHRLDVAKLVGHRVQSLRRNVSAEQRKLVALLVRNVVEDSLVEGGESCREGRMIHTEVLEVEDRPTGSFLFRCAHPREQVAAGPGLVAGDPVHDRLLTAFVYAHQRGEVAEDPFLVVTGCRVHLCTQPSQLLMLVQ